MSKYIVELDVDVCDCFDCPFIRQVRMFDNVPCNVNQLSRVTGIEREEFHCGISNKRLDVVERATMGDCPLKKMSEVKYDG